MITIKHLVICRVLPYPGSQVLYIALRQYDPAGSTKFHAASCQQYDILPLPGFRFELYAHDCRREAVAAEPPTRSATAKRLYVPVTRKVSAKFGTKGGIR